MEVTDRQPKEGIRQLVIPILLLGFLAQINNTIFVSIAEFREVTWQNVDVPVKKYYTLYEFFIKWF